jgi:hypothetical protein
LSLLQDKVRSNAGTAASTTGHQQARTPGDPAESDIAQNLEALRRSQNPPDDTPVPAPLERLHHAVASQPQRPQQPDSMPEYVNVTCNGGPVTLEASDGYLVPNTPVAMNYDNRLFSECSREYENVAANGIKKMSVVSNGGVPCLPPKPAVAPTSGKLSAKDDRVFFRDDAVLLAPNCEDADPEHTQVHACLSYDYYLFDLFVSTDIILL